MLTKSQTEPRKPSVRDMWVAGYRQHPVTKEWLPREQVIAVVEVMKTQRRGLLKPRSARVA